jgi:hypothetical protein
LFGAKPKLGFEHAFKNQGTTKEPSEPLIRLVFWRVLVFRLPPGVDGFKQIVGASGEDPLRPDVYLRDSLERTTLNKRLMVANWTVSIRWLQSMAR